MKLYQVAFKMITRRQGGGDESVLDDTLEEPTTKPTQLAFEGDLVLRKRLTEKEKVYTIWKIK